MLLMFSHLLFSHQALSNDNDQNRDEIREAGAIIPLVSLLDATFSRPAIARSARANAAGALKNLSIDNPQNRQAIRAAGGVQKLVEMLAEQQQQQQPQQQQQEQQRISAQ
jgi:antirestriction protein ArdC